MDGNDFDSLRPFRTEDAARMNATWGRSTVLATALWGRTSEDLRRQLLAPHPEIPPGFDLADFHHLQQITETLSASSETPRLAWLSHLNASSATVMVGTQQLTTWEARFEIVRRAIQYLKDPSGD